MDSFNIAIPTLLSILNVLLCISFIIHLLTKFYSTTNKHFLFFWIAFWSTLILAYLVTLFGNYNPYSFTSLVIINIINILNPIFLGISSEYFGIDGNNKPKWLKWLLSIPALVFLIYLLDFTSFGTLVSYLNFLALVIYSGRYFKLVEKKREIITILLYVYASVNIIFPFIYQGRIIEIKYYLLLTSIVLPLKIALYLSSYNYLNNLIIKKEVTTLENNSKEQKKIDPLPDPNIEVSLTGLWGFLYIMWKYPSGKFVVFVIFLSLLFALMFITTNLASVKELLNSALINNNGI